MKADRIWQAKQCDEAQADLVARELGISPVTARLLCIRGLDDVAAHLRICSSKGLSTAAKCAARTYEVAECVHVARLS